MNDPVVIVHGGAGRLGTEQLAYPAREAIERGLADALRAGQAELSAGGGALDAACAAVVSLEDCPQFNAGRGAVFCADGTVELCASVMDGRDLSVGAMVGLRRTRNPVLGARSVTGHLHGLLSGAHADAYAEAQGLEMVAPDYFHVPERKAQWERLRGSSQITLDHSTVADAQGTVGAVALDANGNLAAATSTGGLVNQLPGRVGDTPIVGAGTWADNRTCAVSTTGKGDAFARVAFARRVADLIDLAGLSAEQAAERALGEVKYVGGEGGCILLTRDGRIQCPFNSPQLMRGWVAGDGDPVVAILPGEAIVRST
ncbi:MAG: isoaspartyl peptidase/L-asparaginase [Pirellulales bacterium]|nr:isoaspartyl peptidase/L-asparaginase [Pirellulales bacterium]